MLTNPPFGKKSSITIINGEGKADGVSDLQPPRLLATTSNKQLFLQHVRTMLKTNGRAAIVVPDNVLFEGGAGETVRRNLLQSCDVHTLLRLPTGVFYAQGVKANVLFFDRRPAGRIPGRRSCGSMTCGQTSTSPSKTNPLKDADLQDFVRCYNPENRRERTETERFHAFSYDELVKRDKASLDIFWLKDEPGGLGESARAGDPGGGDRGEPGDCTAGVQGHL